MTPLRKRMIDDMVSAGLAPNTQAAYIRGVHGLAAHYRRSPGDYGELSFHPTTSLRHIPSSDAPSILRAPQRYLFRGCIDGEQEALWSENYNLCTRPKLPYKSSSGMEQKSGAKINAQDWLCEGIHGQPKLGPPDERPALRAVP